MHKEPMFNQVTSHDVQLHGFCAFNDPPTLARLAEVLCQNKYISLLTNSGIYINL